MQSKSPRIANTAIRKRKQQEREEATGKQGEGKRNGEEKKEEESRLSDKKHWREEGEIKLRE